MVDRCMRTDSSSCDPSRDTAGGTTRGVLPHTPVNHMVFSYYISSLSNTYNRYRIHLVSVVYRL